MAKIKLFIEEECVTVLNGSFSVNVKPGAGGGGSDLKIVPSSGSLPDEQVGVPVVGDKLATVSGGVPPYDYQFSGQPSGMHFDEKDNGDGTFDVVTLGTPDVGADAGSPYTVVMTVTDSATPAASARRSLTVR